MRKYINDKQITLYQKTWRIGDGTNIWIGSDKTKSATNNYT